MFDSLSDEYICLPSGFIYAGSLGIVCSLWAVDDFATAFLMIKLYENIKTDPAVIAIALREAQRWLRNATQPEFIKWTEKLNLNSDQRRNIDRWVKNKYDEEIPFQNPQYWAGFCVIGQ